MPLSDTSVFNPQCGYVLDGMKVGYVDAGQIIATSAGITSTTVTVNATNKTTRHVVQYNWSNATDYGWSATSSILYSCP